MANNIFAVWDAQSNRYSFNTRGADEVEISSEQFASLLAGQARGKVIARDEHGMPMLADPLLPSDVLVEREWRNAQIERVRWLGERHRDELELERQATLDGAQYKALLNYLQALRDWPTSRDFPALDQRPEQPAWLEQQLASPAVA